MPDYAALLKHPATYRGDLFLIEGDFAGRPRQLPLARPGDWGDTMTEWVLRVREDPDEVAVVYFVDPEGELKPPSRGAPVRTVGRFYKVWSDRDLANQPTPFLLFVARAPTAVTTAPAAKGMSMGAWVVILVVLAGAFYILRRYVVSLRHPKPLATRRLAEAGRDQPAEDDQPTSLPDDPADALDALTRRSE